MRLLLSETTAGNVICEVSQLGEQLNERSRR